MHPEPPNSRSTEQVDPRLEPDEALLADLNAPPSLEQARESSEYWQNRYDQLPIHRRAERKEAERMAARWKERLAQAERERYGPSLLEQLFSLLGVRRPPRLPSRRKVVFGLSVIVFMVVLTLVVLTVLTIVFWPQIEPIVRTFLNNNNGN